jgi:hypothetical protein
MTLHILVSDNGQVVISTDESTTQNLRPQDFRQIQEAFARLTKADVPEEPVPHLLGLDVPKVSLNGCDLLGLLRLRGFKGTTEAEMLEFIDECLLAQVGFDRDSVRQYFNHSHTWKMIRDWAKAHGFKTEGLFTHRQVREAFVKWLEKLVEDSQWRGHHIDEAERCLEAEENVRALQEELNLLRQKMAKAQTAERALRNLWNSQSLNAGVISEANLPGIVSALQNLYMSMNE